MFNVLSGLQDGSYSVTIVSRSSNGPTYVKGNVVTTVGGKVSPANAADSAFVEFIFEDLTGQSSGKYTVCFGSLEAQCDQLDDVTNGAITIDDKLTSVNGIIAKATPADVTAGNFWGKVISIDTICDFTKGGNGAKTATFRTR
jgi:hypothetical protein